MQDAFVVGGLDPGADLPQQHERALDSNRALATKELIKRFAFHVFHHQKENTFVALAKVGDVDHVRVLNRSRGSGFPLKASDRLALLQVFVRKHVGPNRFDCDAPS